MASYFRKPSVIRYNYEKYKLPEKRDNKCKKSINCKQENSAKVQQ